MGMPLQKSHLGILHMESSAPMKHYINPDFCSALYCFLLPPASRSRHPLLFSLQIKLLVEEVCYVVWLWYSLLPNYKNTFPFRASTLALGKPSPWEQSCNTCTGNPSPSKLEHFQFRKSFPSELSQCHLGSLSPKSCNTSVHFPWGLNCTGTVSLTSGSPATDSSSSSGSQIAWQPIH